MAPTPFGNQVDAEDLPAAVRELADKLEVALSPETAVRVVTREIGSPSAEVTQIRTMLEAELGKKGLRVAGDSDQTAPAVRISVSQGIAGQLLIAEAPGPGEPEVIIIPYATGRSAQAAGSRRVWLSKSLLWRQSEPILDARVERGDLWVLSPSSLVVYKTEAGAWKENARWTLEGASASRDPRGRLAAIGELPVALLPGLECSVHEEGSGRLKCRPSSRGWPMVPSDPSTLVFAKPGGNYFERLQSTGLTADLPPFFAAAPMYFSEGGQGWAIALLDGVTRLFDASMRQTAVVTDWGSDLVGRRPGPDCAPSLIAVVGSEGGRDGLRAFRLAGASVMPASDVLQLDGSVAALWAGSGASLTLVVKEKDSYAAWLLDTSCAD